jgi:1-acyl-sn-glycerol-3-phosphate acyltransferase
LKLLKAPISKTTDISIDIINVLPINYQFLISKRIVKLKVNRRNIKIKKRRDKMQNIVIDKPYKFIKPGRSKFWLKLFELYIPRYLRKSHGIHSWEIIGKEHLEKSIKQKYSIMLTPNHCRPADPMLIGMLCREMGISSYIMASWHLFMQEDLYAKILPKVGVFSIYREGIDRDSIKFAITTLTEAERVLVLFPEGVVSRTNNKLNHLMEGTSFIAGTAAKKRISTGKSGKSVVHPVAIRYFFDGDIDKTLSPVLAQMEKRLTWQPATGTPLKKRIEKIAHALLGLKEINFFGAPMEGSVSERIENLITNILHPLEDEWLSNGYCDRSEDVISRVKKLRMAILPDITKGNITDNEKNRRWKQLADIYLAQQLSLYPPGYLGETPTPEELLETVERLEEDLTDKVTLHSPLKATIEIGEAIEVNPQRNKTLKKDPLMQKIEFSINKMLLSKNAK